MSSLASAAAAPSAPTDIARETLRRLAVTRLAPTPENYATVYQQIAGQPESSPQPEIAWHTVIREFLRQWDLRHAGLTPARKREALERAFAAAGHDARKLADRLSSLAQGWAHGAASRELEPAAEPTPVIGGLVKQLRELLAGTLASAVIPRLGHDSDHVEQAAQLSQAIRSAHDAETLRPQADALRRFWIEIELRGQTQADLLAATQALLVLVVRHLTELALDEQRPSPQLEHIQAILLERPDLAALKVAEGELREVLFRQGALKKRLDDAKSAVRRMVAVFIERLGALGHTTSEYSTRIGNYAKGIEDAGDIASLTGLVAQLLADTRSQQADAVRATEELVHSRQQVHEYEERIGQLEQELEQVAGLVREDALTGTLNRRGLEEAFNAESARGDRRGSTLSLAVLDIDNFKLLNDRLGHLAGDAALAHLARVVRATLRPSDVVARYGGEEFVFLLPDTGAQEGTVIMQRVQRELTRRFFMHNHERVLITFSAGVAERLANETREQLIERADQAMYQAKHDGKNRVVIADGGRIAA